MFTTVNPISDQYGCKHQRHTIDIVCPQTPRLDHGKCANNEAPEGIWDDLFLTTRPGGMEDEGVVIKPMEFRRTLDARCDFPVPLVDE